MGNSASSSGRGQHEELVDYGHLCPQGIYTGPRDWNETVVAQLIIDRKLAPFYRPLEEYEDSWDDDQILAARKEAPPPADNESVHTVRSDAASYMSKASHHKRPSATKEPSRSPEAMLYRGAIECPICFLYYPKNINRSRCCDQVICTECFVQIKRAEPTVTHLVSEPACCPYCVQEHFGIVYQHPSWRQGIGSDGSSPLPWSESSRNGSVDLTSVTPGKQRRRKSFNHNDAEVVTTDQIRPDWEQKLATVRAQAARRANRRIIMRQVGDRLIPVGVTSGRVHALPDMPADNNGEGNNGNGGGTRRSRRRQQQELSQLLGGMGLGGQDLEELMVMEAMRLSLVEHEEQQRREAQQRAENGGEGGSSDNVAAANANGTTASQPSANGPVQTNGTSTSPPATPPVASATPETTSSSSHANSPPSPSSRLTHLRSASHSRTPVPSAPPSPSARRTPLPPVQSHSPASSAGSTPHLPPLPSLEPMEPHTPVQSPPPRLPRLDSDSDAGSSMLDGDDGDDGQESYAPLDSSDSLVSQEPLLQDEQ